MDVYSSRVRHATLVRPSVRSFLPSFLRSFVPTPHDEITMRFRGFVTRWITRGAIAGLIASRVRATSRFYPRNDFISAFTARNAVLPGGRDKTRRAAATNG